jgi:hypothetical protein
LLLAIARDAAWLLDQRLDLDFLELQAQYRSIFRRCGLAAGESLVRGQALDSFTSFYTIRLLNALGLRLTDEREISRSLFRSLESVEYSHPVWHLLILRWAGAVLMSESPTYPSELLPLDPALRPCASAIRLGEQQLPIRTCRTDPETRRVCAADRRCGYLYAHLDLDASEPQCASTELVSISSTVWNSVLKELWIDPSRTQREIARQLDSRPLAVLRQAVRQELPYPRDLHRGATLSSPGSQAGQIIVDGRATTINTELHRYQKMLIGELEERPDLTQRELQRACPGAVYHVNTYDRDWWNQNILPRLRGSKAPRRPVVVSYDWKTLDKQMARQILQLANEWYARPGRPTRFSKSTLLRELNLPASRLIPSNVSNAPQSVTLVKQIAESYEDFAIRRLRWALDLYPAEGVRPTVTEVLQRAGESLKGRCQRAKRMVEEALEAWASSHASRL